MEAIEIDRDVGDYFPADDGFVKLVRHEPLGVCAAINPFNAPVATLILKAAPALATGNVLIVKPSEKTPLGTLAIAPLFEAAGFPKGCIQVVTGAGPTGELLARHMRIRKVSFTGSIPTGKKIQVAAAQSSRTQISTMPSRGRSTLSSRGLDRCALPLPGCMCRKALPISSSRSTWRR
jgi:acyl-CoA reductase-like NAD-dependent aldehyde dehydrogenase